MGEFLVAEFSYFFSGLIVGYLSCYLLLTRERRGR